MYIEACELFSKLEGARALYRQVRASVMDEVHLLATLSRDYMYISNPCRLIQWSQTKRLQAEGYVNSDRSEHHRYRAGAPSLQLQHGMLLVAMPSRASQSQKSEDLKGQQDHVESELDGVIGKLR